MPRGPERDEALRKAQQLRYAAEAYNYLFSKELKPPNRRLEPRVPKVHFCTFGWNQIPDIRVLRWAVGRISRGNIVLSRDYFVSQVTSLLKFAKETINPQLAAVLIEKAADLKSQVDESSTTPDPSPQTPDVQPETSPTATSSP